MVREGTVGVHYRIDIRRIHQGEADGQFGDGEQFEATQRGTFAAADTGKPGKHTSPMLRIRKCILRSAK